jgi:hypothetical protein
MPTPEPKRRWFQFKLRTLLIGMTLLAIPCGYVGQQKAIVMHRAAERQWLEQHGARFFVNGKIDILPDVPLHPSPLRMMLGDCDVSFIRLPDESLKERAERAFPESLASDGTVDFSN